MIPIQYSAESCVELLTAATAPCVFRILYAAFRMTVFGLDTVSIRDLDLPLCLMAGHILGTLLIGTGTRVICDGTVVVGQGTVIAHGCRIDTGMWIGSGTRGIHLLGGLQPCLGSIRRQPGLLWFRITATQTVSLVRIVQFELSPERGVKHPLESDVFGRWFQGGSCAEETEEVGYTGRVSSGARAPLCYRRVSNSCCRI